MTVQNVLRVSRRELKALRRNMLPSLRRLVPIIALTVVGTFAFAACAPAAAQSPTTPPTLPAPSPTALPQQPVTLTVLQMITASNGWATGSATVPLSGQDIFRTSDGGQHWQNVSPTDAPHSQMGATFFLDPTHAWVTLSSPVTSTTGSPSVNVTVFHTADGGSTWSAGTPVTLAGDGGSGGPGQLDFVDAQHGWLLAGLGAAAGSEAVELFKTSDGGMYWEETSLTSGYPDQSTPGSLPFGCDKSGITFVDASTGWATGTCAGGQLFFYATHDGGQTWHSQTLPPPPGYPSTIFSSCQCVVDPPAFVSPQDGFLHVEIYEQKQDAYLYVTHDAGATWTALELPVTHLIGEPSFVNPDVGWIIGGGQLYLTHNGGQTWTAIGQLPIPDDHLYLSGNPDFVDANNGWILSDQGVYVTHDGGHTWSAITPTTTPSSNRTVTLADDGQTITLHTGDRFLLDLGEDYTWTVTVDNPAVLSRVVNVLVIRGAQGIYEAHTSGTAILTATGDPVCRQAQPPCGAPSRVFTLQVVVE